MKPIRVVLLGGAVPDPGALRLLEALRAHPEIEVVAALAESPGFALRHRVRDLWNRRGWLLFPLLLADAARAALGFVTGPVRYGRNRRRMATMAAHLEAVEDLHAPAVLERLRRLEPDLGLVYGAPILRETLFAIPRQGTLGIHHGKVPQYRGKKTTFWAMYNGDPSVGVTIQRLNERLDGGEIVAEGEVRAAGRSYGAVWKDLEDLGVELFLAAVLDVAAGRAIYRPQVGDRGPLYRDPAPSDLVRFFFRRRSPRLTARDRG